MTTYTLDKNKLDDAMSILDTELKALKSTAQTVREANSGWSVVINYIFLFGILLIGIPLNHAWISWEMALISGVALYAVLCLSAFFSGFRSIRAFLRLRRLQRDLRLDRIKWFVGWKELWARILRLLPMYLGILVLVVSIVYRDFKLWICDIGLMFCVFGSIVSLRLLASRWLLPFQKRIEENQRLRLRLKSSQKPFVGFDEDQTISIPETEYKQIAQIERALIFMDQKRTIKESSRIPDTSVWSVQQSASTMRKKSTLAPPIWLSVQKRIDELSTNPQPTDALKDADGIWRVAVPETSCEISYTVAENPQRVVIHDLFEKDELKRRNQEGGDA